MIGYFLKLGYLHVADDSLISNSVVCVDETLY